MLDACLAWHRTRRRKVFVEYLMLAGVNDRHEQAAALASVLSPARAFKVNLIPYNPTGTGFEGSSRAAIAAFREVLDRGGHPGDRPPHPRPRHRRRLRAARRDALIGGR